MFGMGNWEAMAFHTETKLGVVNQSLWTNEERPYRAENSDLSLGGFHKFLYLGELLIYFMGTTSEDFRTINPSAWAGSELPEVVRNAMFPV